MKIGNSIILIFSIPIIDYWQIYLLTLRVRGKEYLLDTNYYTIGKIKENLKCIF